MVFRNPSIKIALWLLMILAVIGIGLYYVPREASHPGFLESFYITMRLFIFERDLPSFPSSWPLVMIHFLAPLVTLSAMGTLITLLFRLSPRIRTRFMRDHVIICGAGRVGRLIAEHLHRSGVSLAAVDYERDASITDWASACGIPVLKGDFRSPDVMRKAGALRARTVIFSSGDDLANTEASLAAYALLKSSRPPYRIIWTHISDDALAETLRESIRTTGTTGIRFFDTYHMAAERLLELYSPLGRSIKIVGLGKFGTDLLELMIREKKLGRGTSITVIDTRDVSAALARVAGRLPTGITVSFLRMDIRDLRGKKEKESSMFFLCTDDDIGNLSLALHLSSKGASTGSKIFVRMTNWPLLCVSETLGNQRGIVFININDLIRASLDHLPGTASPATRSDLKRTLPLHQ